MLKRKALEREPSTGNVFADLGLADAGERLIKAGLAVRIGRIIRQRKLTQAAAAQLMCIDQPKVSPMQAGQFRGYSVERLMRFLVALGHDVEIVVKPRKRGIVSFTHSPGFPPGGPAAIWATALRPPG